MLHVELGWYPIENYIKMWMIISGLLTLKSYFIKLTNAVLNFSATIVQGCGTVAVSSLFIVVPIACGVLCWVIILL